MCVGANFLFQITLHLFAIPTEATVSFLTVKMHFGFAESNEGEIFL